MPTGFFDTYTDFRGWLHRVRLRSRLSEAQNHRCCYCGVQMTTPGNHPNSVTLEHIQPKAHGGLTDYWNCVVACYRCNCARGTQNPTKFFQALCNPTNSCVNQQIQSG